MSVPEQDAPGHPADPWDPQDVEAFDVQLDITIYRAALGAQATRVAPSLLDFLR